LIDQKTQQVACILYCRMLSHDRVS
jgi:hypothetical protein